jgi:hypothetical protein
MQDHLSQGCLKASKAQLSRQAMTLLCLAVAWCASGYVQAAGNSGNAINDAERAATSGKDPIPGPRSCFWARGPASGDPYINIAYPDSATFYWAAVFTLPPNAKLTLEGKFPHSRYMSFISYDEAGQPVESVADYLIKPRPGSINPYLVGADRQAGQRDYALDIVDAHPGADTRSGMNLVGEQRDKLNTPKYGKAPGQQAILYRIYVRDKNTDETGDTGLPVPVLTLADGTVLRGAASCQALRTRQALQLDPAAMAVPMEKYRELLAEAAKKSPVFPATNPPTWHQQFDREALYGIYTGKPPAIDAHRSVGGFYPNLDNQYIRTIINRKLGKLLVIRAKAPTTPHTVQGDARMGGGELRYWSFCSNQGFANTRVNDCVHDENIPVGPDGFYTIVLSRKADRPRNAIPQCGVAWLPMADDGDGAVDDDVTVLQLRHMLGTQSFKHSVQAIGKPGDEAKDMADYFPRGRYMSPSAFEIALPCLIEKR